MQSSFLNVLQMSSNYSKCLMKMEPAASAIPRGFTTQFSDLSYPSVPLTVDSYGWPDRRLTSQRILPPPELDCLLSPSQWSPPFPVSPDQLRRLSLCRESRASSVEVDDYVEAAMPVELRSQAALTEYRRVDELHCRMSHDDRGP